MNNKHEKEGQKKRLKKLFLNLTDEELKKIAKRYFEIIEDKDKKHEASRIKINNSRKTYIYGLYRTIFYKKANLKYIHSII
ncbi:hypothetical protein [Candidatus Mycoplasma mahonii]|uniref:hypothetical protein n=1 Tax=Candidatus Mycoplasma mahonii TaxID=3004105 RepID=UPI0026E92FBB|nr:hypothetical protein [Candidatus Mycoplasma mahonii]WKX02730.1 hypothetical protein O3I44_01480 [Candidatus Mycoplasma mahonii]